MRGILPLLLVCLSAFPVAAASPDRDAELRMVIATLEEGYHLLNDLQADFTQKTTIAALKRDEKGNGELSLRRSAGNATMFRFDYRKPKQQIVSDGKQVWFYIPDNKQVMVSELKAMLAQGGVALNYLAGLGSVSRDFSISFAEKVRDANGNYLIDLVPRKSGQAFAQLQLTISSAAVETYRDKGAAQAPFPVVASVVIDQMGNRTLIEYSKIRVNQGLAPDRFTFKIPKGVDVIKP
jgi:outer membrane lipoprotein carrier protein